MSDIVRCSEAASIGIHALMLLASSSGRLLSARVMADRLGVSEAHLAKVLQRLGRAGYVASVRGPGGGFRLELKLEDVNLLAIYEAIDGPLTTDRCLLGLEFCEGARCVVGSLLRDVQHQIRTKLAATTLADVNSVIEMPA